MTGAEHTEVRILHHPMHLRRTPRRNGQSSRRIRPLCLCVSIEFTKSGPAQRLESQIVYQGMQLTTEGIIF